MNSKIQQAISFDIKTSYKEIDEKLWNASVGKKILLSYSYLKSIEDTTTDIEQFYYITYYQNKEVIGVAVFQKLIFDIAQYDFEDFPCSFSSKLLLKFIKNKTNILICGNIFATGENIFSFKNGVNIESVYQYLEDSIQWIIKKDKSLKYVVYKEFLDSNETSNYLMKKYQYLKFNIDVNMKVDLKARGKNLDEYVQLFKAKSRTKVNKVLNNSASLKIRELSHVEIKENGEKISELYNLVLKNSNFNLGIFNDETFSSLKEKLKEDYKFFGYFFEGNLVGFKTFFQYENVLEASFVGIDYSLNSEINIYQRILLDFINYAIENNIETLCLGRTAETIKSNFGATPVNMDLFAKHRNKIGQSILKQFINFVKPSEFSLRKPFKIVI